MAMQDAADTSAAAAVTSSPADCSPFDTLPCGPLHLPDRSRFVRGVYAHAGTGTNVVLLVGRVVHDVHEETHLFLVFSGGPDDGLRLISSCSSVRTRVCVTVLRLSWSCYVPPLLDSPKEAPTAAATDRALADVLS